MKVSTAKPSAFSGISSDIQAVPVHVLEQLFDQAPDVVFFIKDSLGRYVTVNHSLMQRYGMQHKPQVMGRRPNEICPGDLGRIPAEQDAAVLRTGRPLLDHLELHWYAPHKPGWCLTTKLPLRNAEGDIAGLIGFSRDVRTRIDPRDIPAGVAASLAYLETHPAEPQTPSALAKRAGLSPSKFARLLKRIFGLTPSQYITKTRLAAATRLLQETDRPVADVALDCGFYDHSAFSRAFHSATGLTPTQYRKRQGNGQEG